MTQIVDPEEAASIAFEPFLHEASDSVRFQVRASGALVNASVSRQALRYSFKSADLSADLLSIYNIHSSKIHEAVLRRLAQGAREPVMLRESNFPAPPL